MEEITVETPQVELIWTIEKQKDEIQKLTDRLEDLEGENELLRETIWKMALDRYCNYV